MARHWVYLLGVLCFVAGVWASPWMYRLALGPERPAAGAGTNAVTAPPRPPATASPVGTAGAHAGMPLAELYQRLKAAVVNVSTLQVVRGSSRRLVFDPTTRGLRIDVPEETRESRGSGLLLTPDGSILTNHHVVAGSSQIVVQLADGSYHPARVVGDDEATDLALLRIEGVKGLQTAELGDSDRVSVGDPVFAIGNPFGLGHSLTTGIVSYKGRPLGFRDGPDEFIQTDTPINPGNSGGPLFDMGGRVIGVNTLVQRESQGIGFSIPINVARRVVPVLEQHGYFPRGYLGVVFGRTRPEGVKRGALVSQVISDTPADGAGIRPGDVLVQLGDAAVDDAEGAARALNLIPAGTAVPVGLWRDGRVETVSVTLGDLKELARRPVESVALGVVLSPADPLTLARVGLPQGVVVQEVRPGGRAEGRLAVGDLLLMVDDSDATTPAAVAGLLARPGRHLITLVRGRTILRQYI